MKITCQQCGKTFVVPDEKIPANKRVRVQCPGCKTPISLSRPAENAQAVGDGCQQQLMGEDLIEKIVATSKAMPPMPQILAKAREIINDENKGFQEIAEVLETDQAMATRVLRIANSAYYGLTVPASSVRQASALLGSQTLLELITLVSMSRLMGSSLPGYGFSSVSLWQHTLTVATASKTIAEQKYPDLVNDAFNAGLIHDCGMIVLDEYVAARKGSRQVPAGDEKALLAFEKSLFGCDHADTGAAILEKWNIPQLQTYAIRHHHYPQNSDMDELACILHASECLAQYGPEIDNILDFAEKGVFERLQMPPETVESIYNSVMESVEEIVSGFSA